jgi:clan AA aspartic protease (TIGR02281 family)
MKKRSVAGVMLVLACICLIPFTAYGEIYQYEDDSGTTHFVDDPGRIPRKYLKKQRIHGEVGDDTMSRVTRVSINGNQVLVPVRLSYKGREVQAVFILDTGASSCTINPSLADRLQINPSDAGRALARTVGGGVYMVGHTKLDYIVAGPNRKYDVEVSVIQSPQADGLLGMNFLRELRYHVDFNTSTIRWGD